MKANVLFILTDDQRYNTINALGNPDIITPNLDQLVREGTSYTNAYIEGGFTGAVCMPSRGMIHTGRHLCGLYNLGEDVPKDHITLGETFRNQGYHSFGTGKWHNGTPAFARSFDSGENIFFGGMWDHWNVPVCTYDPLGNYDNEINFVANFFENRQTISVLCDHFNPGIHSTDLLTESTIKFLKAYDGEKPFFSYTAYLAPHDPRTMPQRYLDMYKDREISLPVNCTETYPVAYEGAGMRDEDLTPYPRDLERSKSELIDYYAMITHLDEQIGNIIKTLKKKQLYDNTIIILCGDNGLGIGSHGFLGKQNHYEHSLKVPLIFRGPGIPQNRQVSANVLLTDIYPTLCDMLHIETPSSVMGQSFIHTLEHDTQYRESIYYMLMDRVRSIREGDFKLSVYIAPNKEYTITLYNVVDDPDELHNLAKIEEHLTQELLEKLIRMRDANEEYSRKPSQVYWEAFDSLNIL